MEERFRLHTTEIEKEIEEQLDRCWRSLAIGQKKDMPKEEWMKLMEYAQCLLGLHESIKSANASGNGISMIFEKYVYPTIDTKEE